MSAAASPSGTAQARGHRRPSFLTDRAFSVQSVVSTTLDSSFLSRNTSDSASKKSKTKELPPLFWYMEAGKWDRAEQRARRHPREFKTWVTIRTKATASPLPDAHDDAKRLALHHACFKLRSAGSAAPPDTAEPDPFIEACRFIVMLVAAYPEAAGQRESRHGCLPLHLAAFASCASRTSTSTGSTTSHAGSETSMSSHDFNDMHLDRPNALNRRSASDNTTATAETKMSAIYYSDEHRATTKPHQQPPLYTANACSPNYTISPARETAAAAVINALLDAFPKAIKVDSEGGRLPLHTACAGRATPRVVAVLVTAYPAAARHRNKDGFLPLHLAAHWGVSHPAVAITLLKAYPDATVGRNRWERTPLEEALCMAGENGRPHQAALVRALRKHPSFWTRPVEDLLLEGGSPGRAAPVDIDESLASTTEEEDQQLPHNLYSPSPREQAVLEDSEFAATGQEVVVKEVAGFVGRFVSGLSLDSRNNVPLSNLIQNRRWSAVVDRIHANPLEPEEDLRVLTRGGFMANTGMTALHYACERDPPLPVVQALIEAHPMAVLTRCMPGGALPLHIACTWHCSPAVVDALVAADPGGCKMRDELGNVALHSACFSGADAAVVATLLEIPKPWWPGIIKAVGPWTFVNGCGMTIENWSFRC
jgi:ankyrin repeat protein